MADDGPSFCRKLRDATKDVHDTSDKLVNIKLGLSCSDNNVWANGLLVFSKIFFYLEECMDKFDALSDLDLPGLRRRKGFEEDLDFYLGSSWRSKEDNPAVKNYLSHLRKIAEDDDEPYLLVAYIYHLYMGLLSGGQILSKKRSIFSSGSEESNQKIPGNAVTFLNGESPSAMKKKLRAATNELADGLDQDLQDRIIQEGVNVFKLNNSIIHTVEGVDEIFYKRLLKFLAILAVVFAVCYVIFS